MKVFPGFRNKIKNFETICAFIDSIAFPKLERRRIPRLANNLFFCRSFFKKSATEIVRFFP